MPAFAKSGISWEQATFIARPLKVWIRETKMTTITIRRQEAFVPDPSVRPRNRFTIVR